MLMRLGFPRILNLFTLVMWTQSQIKDEAREPKYIRTEINMLASGMMTNRMDKASSGMLTVTFMMENG